MHRDGRTSIELASPGSVERTMVIPDSASAPILAPTPGGKTYLLYLRDPSLVAQEYDEASGKVRGNAVVLVSEIGRVGGAGTRPAVGVSPTGILAYQNGNGASQSGELVWFDRSGKRLSQLPPAAAGSNPTLSPDGRFAAVGDAFAPESRGIQLVDLVRGVSTRFTFAPGSGWPVWSPDGKRVAFQSTPDGKPGIYVKDANGAGAEQLLAPGPGIPSSWSPDGQSILFTENVQALLLPLNGDKKPISAGFLSVFGQSQATISPDGKYLAFSAADSGRTNVYVQAMPPNIGKWQISVDGGAQPRWRRDGKELFFLSQDSEVMAVDVNPGVTLTAGIPHELFRGSPYTMAGRRYDVSADGQRFLMYLPNSAAGNAPITVVMNWWAGLKK
jgi:eukaryotic-like serine/threonine-protein kinase